MGNNINDLYWPEIEIPQFEIDNLVVQLQDTINNNYLGTDSLNIAKRPVYHLGDVDPVGFVPSSIMSGCDTRVFVNEEVLGSVQAFSIQYTSDGKEAINIVGLAIDNSTPVLDYHKKLNGRTIRITATNEYGSHIDFVVDRILQVDSFGFGVSVDDMAVEWELQGVLLPLEE